MHVETCGVCGFGGSLGGHWGYCPERSKATPVTPEAALSLMLSRAHEAMGKPRAFDECTVCEAPRFRHPAQTFAEPPRPISPRPVVASLLRDVAAGIRVLRDIDGLPLTDKQINDRSANIVMGLLGNYRIEEI
jgi:hypothetical protein